MRYSIICLSSLLFIWKGNLKRKYNLKIMLNAHWAVRVYTKCDELASKRWILGGICRQNTDNQASFEKKTKQTTCMQQKQAEDASDITSADLFRLSSKSNEMQPKIWITSRRIQRISIIIATTKNTKQHKTCYGKLCVCDVRALELPIFNSKHFNAMPMLVRYRWNSNTTEYTHRTHIVY